MNYKMILNTLGKVALIEAGLLSLPLITAIIYSESCVLSILLTIGVALAIGLVLNFVFKQMLIH